MNKLVFIFLISPLVINAQFPKDSLRDNIWLIGNGPEDVNPLGGNMMADFRSTPLVFNTYYTDINFLRSTDASVCDTLGNLLFCTNGIQVFNRNNQLMMGWDTLNHGNIANGNFNLGYPPPQSAIILPLPDNDHSYYIIHTRVDIYANIDPFYNIIGDVLFYSVVDMNGDGGAGEMTDVNHTIISDFLEYGSLTACRHANGRDWWITMNKFNSHERYVLLLDPQGIHNMGLQYSGFYQRIGLGQTSFSPDGQYYSRSVGISSDTGHYFNIFNFDRCSGTFTDLYEEHLMDIIGTGIGCAFSPNSRYVYLNMYTHIYQYDLMAADIGASKTTVAVWDGYLDMGVYPTNFGTAQLGPDGKIYIVASSSSRFFSTIDLPDQPGLACTVSQRSVPLPHINNRALPNFPYFRLGPIDGSACDTLGIDMPVAVVQPTVVVPLEYIPMNAYPNPASTSCTIGMGRALPQEGRMEVHDMGGRLVEAHALQRATLGYGLNTAAWPAGSYVATVWCGGEVWGSVQILIEI